MRFAAVKKTLWHLQHKLQTFLQGAEPVDVVPWETYQLDRLEYLVQELMRGLTCF